MFSSSVLHADFAIEVHSGLDGVVRENNQVHAFVVAIQVLFRPLSSTLGTGFANKGHNVILQHLMFAGKFEGTMLEILIIRNIFLSKLSKHSNNKKSFGSLV